MIHTADLALLPSELGVNLVGSTLAVVDRSFQMACALRTVQAFGF